jgi:predicted ArsR family transcriptional regulator
MTATEVGEQIGESPTTCSFHLRQLAKYGLVEEAGGGRGRERPWQATSGGMWFAGAADTPEMAAATGLLESVLAERYFEDLMRWIQTKPTEPIQWQQAMPFGDYGIYVTAAELKELNARIEALLEPYDQRRFDPDLRPAESRPVTLLNLAYPYMGPRRKEES